MVVTGFQVKLRGQDRVVHRPRVLEGSCEAGAKALGSNEVCVAEGCSTEGDDELPTLGPRFCTFLAKVPKYQINITNFNVN